MKKLTFIFLYLFICVLACTAQEKYLTISGGYTIPKGNFAESDLNNPESGYAKKGYNFSFEMAFFLSDYLGLGANLRFNNCDFDSEFFNKKLKEKFKDRVDTINLTSGNYNLHNFLVGPYIKYDIGDYFTIYGKTFIGVMSSYRPNQKLEYQLFGQTMVATETVGKYTGSFAYNFGAGTMVKFSSRLGLNISADYIAGNPTFETFNYKTLETEKRKQPIAYLNYNAGLMLTF